MGSYIWWVLLCLGSVFHKPQPSWYTLIISSEADTCNCLHGEEAGVNRELKCSYESDHTPSSFWKCKCPHWKLWGMHKYLNSCLGTAQPAKSPKQFPSSKLRNIAECLNWEMQQSTLPARKHLPPVRNICIYLFIIFKGWGTAALLVSLMTTAA